jgi:hypothetical protein
MSEPTPQALDLVAQIVDQNVRDLAFTTDRIIESLESQVHELAWALAQVDEIINDALVIDRRTERRLAGLQGKFNIAGDILARKQEAV